MENATSALARADKKKKLKKRKNDEIEEKESTNIDTRLLYNETPSDSVEDESMSKEKKSKKRKSKDVAEKVDKGTRLLDHETPSDQEEESERVLLSIKTHGNPKKPLPFTKVWSNEDEISLLRGVIKFREETSLDAPQHMVEFRRFILGSLVFQPTLIQLREKVRRLRLKYEKSVQTGNGSRTLHELELFQLCEKIWAVNQVIEQPNSSGTVQREQHNLPVNGQEEKKSIPENRQPRQFTILEIGQPSQHNILPVTGVNPKILEALDERIRKDTELVLNSKACLHGTKWEVDLRSFDLLQKSFGLSLKLLTLVHEKAKSPKLQDSPDLLEQEVMKAYLEAKVEHARLLSNAYDSFIKEHSDRT